MGDWRGSGLERCNYIQGTEQSEMPNCGNWSIFINLKCFLFLLD